MNKYLNDPVRSVPEFYAGQSIFLTGATGFLGKVYIEKILRSCPNVREIFILMRPKKGLNLDERLKKMLNLPLYDKLREEQPLNFKKLIPLSGNTSQENLGLSAIDRQMLTERVTIIIHNAASVKFNDSLKYAILTNTRSTRDICILAESTKNLIALVYIGTAYTNLENPFIEEKVYSPIANWRKMIKMAESSDEHVLNSFTAKCLNNIPNTYIFSKKLAESIIQEYSLSLPCAIVRPSIVLNSIRDPIPGWIDNFYGPLGLSIAVAKGLVRVIYMKSNILQNNIPVDIVINTVILVTWKLGVTIFTSDFTCFVVNCTSPQEKNISFRESSKMALKLTEQVPLERILWTPSVLFTESSLMYYVLIMLWHILPAIIIDLILKLLGRQPIALRLQRQIYVANCALQYFMFNEWKFDNTNNRDLMSLIPSGNQKMFSIDLFDDDLKKYLWNGIIGAKKYLLHENMNRVDAAKAHYKRMTLFVAAFKTIIAIGMLWMIYKWICF